MYTSRNTSVKYRPRAFSLVELILAMAILTLLVGVLYSIVDVTLRSAADLREKQNRNREIAAFLALCRQTFSNMPSTVTFIARVVPDGERYSSQLIFRNAPGLLSWGDAANTSVSTILGVRGEAGGTVGLGILQDSEQKIDAYLNGGTASRPWFMLLPDFRDAEWRFFDPGSTAWVKEWNNASNRPAFAELILTTAQGTRSYIFRLPPVVAQQALLQ